MLCAVGIAVSILAVGIAVSTVAVVGVFAEGAVRIVVSIVVGVVLAVVKVVGSSCR